MNTAELQARIAQLELENSRLATIANDQCDKTLLKAAIAGAWEDGYKSNFGPSSPSWIQKCWLGSLTFQNFRESHLPGGS